MAENKVSENFYTYRQAKQLLNYTDNDLKIVVLDSAILPWGIPTYEKYPLKLTKESAKEIITTDIPIEVEFIYEEEPKKNGLIWIQDSISKKDLLFARKDIENLINTNKKRQKPRQNGASNKKNGQGEHWGKNRDTILDITKELMAENKDNERIRKSNGTINATKLADLVEDHRNRFEALREDDEGNIPYGTSRKTIVNTIRDAINDGDLK